MEEGWDWARHADNQNAIRKKHTHTHTHIFLSPLAVGSSQFSSHRSLSTGFRQRGKNSSRNLAPFPGVRSSSSAHRHGPIVRGPSSRAHRRRRPRGRHFPSHSADGNHTADFHRHLIQEHGTENRATQRRRLETNQIQPVGGHIGHFRSGDGPSATGNAPLPSRRPPTTYWEMFYKSMIRKMTTNPSVSEKIPSTRSQEAIWAENTFRFPAARSPCSPAAGNSRRQRHRLDQRRQGEAKLANPFREPAPLDFPEKLACRSDPMRSQVNGAERLGGARRWRPGRLRPLSTGKTSAQFRHFRPCFTRACYGKWRKISASTSNGSSWTRKARYGPFPVSTTASSPII